MPPSEIKYRNEEELRQPPVEELDDLFDRASLTAKKQAKRESERELIVI
jgi:hypothetical protein